MCLEELSSKMPFSSQNIWLFRELLFSILNAYILVYKVLGSVTVGTFVLNSVLKCMFSCCDKGAQNVCLSPLHWQDLLFDVGLQNRPLSNLIYFLSPPYFLHTVRSCLISVLIALTGQPMRKILSLPVYNVSSIHVSQRRSHSKLA